MKCKTCNEEIEKGDKIICKQKMEIGTFYNPPLVEWDEEHEMFDRLEQPEYRHVECDSE